MSFLVTAVTLLLPPLISQSHLLISLNLWIAWSREVLQFFKVIVCKDDPVNSGMCEINGCHFVHLYLLGLF